MSEHYVVTIKSSLSLAAAEAIVDGALGVGKAADLLPIAAVSGIHAAGFASHPEKPSDNWRDAKL